MWYAKFHYEETTSRNNRMVIPRVLIAQCPEIAYSQFHPFTRVKRIMEGIPEETLMSYQDGLIGINSNGLTIMMVNSDGKINYYSEPKRLILQSKMREQALTKIYHLIFKKPET